MQEKSKIMLTKIEAAKRLGFSVRWLERKISSGEVPCVRFGRSVRLRADDVDVVVRTGKWPKQAKKEKVA